MILVDVNLLVYAFRKDLEPHEASRQWLAEAMSAAPYAVSELVLSSFLRLVTSPRIFTSPSPLAAALEFAEAYRDHRHARPITSGPGHWHIFTRLCRAHQVTGNLIPDAYLAALAIEHDCKFYSSDRDFARFPDLRWFNPLPSR